jgi:hypothetical protein
VDHALHAKPGTWTWRRVALYRSDTVPAGNKEVAEVNSLNGLIPTALVFLLVFVVMGVMILWGVSLLDLPG